MRLNVEEDSQCLRPKEAFPKGALRPEHRWLGKLRTAIISHQRHQLPYIILQTFPGSREPSWALTQRPARSENSQPSFSLLSRLQSRSIKSEQPRHRNNITNGAFFPLRVMIFSTIGSHLGNGIAFHLGSKWSRLLLIIHTCRWSI